MGKVPPPGYEPPEWRRPRKKTPASFWISLGAVPLCGCGVLSAILYSVFISAKIAAAPTRCLSNMKQLGLGTQMYANDWDDHLPSAGKWGDQTLIYVRNDRTLFRCPKVGPDEYGYAMLDKASGMDLYKPKDPASFVVLFESSDLTWNAHSPTLNVPVPPRHGGGHVTVYGDAHVKTVIDSR